MSHLLSKVILKSIVLPALLLYSPFLLADNAKPEAATSVQQMDVPEELVLQCRPMYAIDENNTVLPGVQAYHCRSVDAICYLVVTGNQQGFSCVPTAKRQQP